VDNSNSFILKSEKMVVEKDYRPEIQAKWQPAIKTAIKKFWDKDPRKRPSFVEAKKLLYDCVLETGGDDELNSSLDKSGTSFRNFLDKSGTSFRSFRNISQANDGP